jgi:hypothetical protein
MGGACSCVDGDSEALAGRPDASLNRHAQALCALFTHDVFIAVFDADWGNSWSFASSPQFRSEFQTQLRQIQDAVATTEQTIRNLNEGWRVDELTAFRLVCLSSRIWVWLLNETHHLIVVNKVSSGEDFVADPPDLGERATALVGEIRDALLGHARPTVD